MHIALLLGIASFVTSQTSDDDVSYGSGNISDDDIHNPTYTVLKTSTEVGTTARTNHGKNDEDAVITRHNAAFAAMTVVCALVGLAVRTKKICSRQDSNLRAYAMGLEAISFCRR